MVLARAGENLRTSDRMQANAAVRQSGLEAASLTMRIITASTSLHLPVNECETHDRSRENAKMGAIRGGDCCSSANKPSAMRNTMRSSAEAQASRQARYAWRKGGVRVASLTIEIKDASIPSRRETRSVLVNCGTAD
jgi:hypothetical protein